MFPYYRQSLIFLILGLVFTTRALGQEYSGTIVDGYTKERLEGVTVSWGQKSAEQVYSNREGQFTIPNTYYRVVRFQMLGYEAIEMRPADLPRSKLIFLYPSVSTLNDIVVRAGENPAWRIVRNAIGRKPFNDPNGYESYQYVSYNKNVITYNTIADSTLSEEERRQVDADAERARKKHLLVIESATRKFFVQPNRHSELVLGSKISGFENPNIATIPDGIQHFAFYDNYFRLLNKEYLSPLAPGFENRYVFILKDTIIRGYDSTFVMDYFPTKNSNFEGFEGKLHIHSNGWAIEYVTAKPWDEGKVNLSMEQRYRLISGRYWFPVELNFTLDLEKFPFRDNGAVMVGYTYLDSIVVNAPVPEEAFDHVQVKIRENAGLVDSSFWKARRLAPLSGKELNTIAHMDSIGERYHLGAIMRSTRHLYRGFLAMNAINLDLTKLVSNNDYEGFRLGAGLYTNERISKFIQFGGYFGYGLMDEQIKYGAEVKLNFDLENDFWMRYRYKNDLRGPGKIGINYWERVSFAELFYNVLMDRVEQHEILIRSRAFTFHVFEFGAKTYTLDPTYSYQFINEKGELDSRHTFSEINIGWRWIQNEKIIANYGQRITVGSKWPAFRLDYSRGLKGVLGSDFDYNKLELGIQWDYFTPNLGRTLISLESGYVDRALPFGMNFGTRPSYSPSFSFVVPNTFQAMRFNEFTNSEYVAIYFMHDFKTLLFRTGWFKPEFRLFQGVAFGQLRYDDHHINLPAKDMRHGYYESGISIDNIIRINTFNLGYFGVGCGVFYRYGPYQLANPEENFSFKLAFMYSIN